MKRALTILIVAVCMLSAASCVEHRYYVEHHDHSARWHRHHHPPLPPAPPHL